MLQLNACLSFLELPGNGATGALSNSVLLPRVSIPSKLELWTPGGVRNQTSDLLALSQPGQPLNHLKDPFSYLNFQLQLTL